MNANISTKIEIYLAVSCLIEYSWKPLLLAAAVVVGTELENKKKALTGHTVTIRNLKDLSLKVSYFNYYQL